MNKTKIEYLTHTWNPVAMRCTPISEGCRNCWHLRIADWLATNTKLNDELRRVYSGESPPILAGTRLREPLQHKEPAVIGVQFMGDLFDNKVPDQFINKVFDVMREAKQHTFVVLTKRVGRLAFFVKGKDLFFHTGYFAKVYDHIWIGTTAENQRQANKRLHIMTGLPAKNLFVSCEPLLEPIDLRMYLDALRWVIVGPETGKGARLAKEAWVREALYQCHERGVPFFLKKLLPGWGEDLMVREYPKEVCCG